MLKDILLLLGRQKAEQRDVWLANILFFLKRESGDAALPRRLAAKSFSCPPQWSGAVSIQERSLLFFKDPWTTIFPAVLLILHILQGERLNAVKSGCILLCCSPATLFSYEQMNRYLILLLPSGYVPFGFAILIWVRQKGALECFKQAFPVTSTVF